MNRKILIIGALILIIGVILAFSYSKPKGGWQGDGTPLYTIVQGSVHGGVYVEGGHGLTYENPYVEYFEVPEGQVKYARLYIPMWNYDAGDTLNVTVNGNELDNDNDNDNRGEPDYTAAWGIAGYCRNATSYVHSGLNEVAVSYNNPNGGPYGIMLVAVYEDPAIPPTRFWINEGNYALTYTNGKDTTTTTFSGTVPENQALLYTLIIAGNKGEIDELYLDSKLVGTDVGRSDTGSYFDLHRFNVTLSEPNSTLRFERGDEGYIHPFTAILISTSKTDRDFIEIYEQQSAPNSTIPFKVIAVSLIVFIAIIVMYRKRHS
jgi:hypothetical protein